MVAGGGLCDELRSHDSGTRSRVVGRCHQCIDIFDCTFCVLSAVLGLLALNVSAGAWGLFVRNASEEMRCATVVSHENDMRLPYSVKYCHFVRDKRELLDCVFVMVL